MSAVVRAFWATFVRRARWVAVARLDVVSNDGRLLIADDVTVPDSVQAFHPEPDGTTLGLHLLGPVPLRVRDGWVEAALPRRWGTAASAGVDRDVSIDERDGVTRIGGVIGHVAVGPNMEHAWTGQH